MAHPGGATAETAVDAELAAVFAADNDADTYETAVAGLLARRTTEGVFAVQPQTAALSAADRDHRAADQAMREAAGDVAAMTAIVRNQISFVEVYLLRVLAVLGLAVPIRDAGSWWAHLARMADTHTPS